MTILIGLVGPLGSGKTTAAKYLEAAYGAKIYSFAAPLKALVSEAFNLTHSQVYGTQAEKEAIDPRYGLSGRDFQKKIGEAAKAVWGTQFWTRQVIDAVREYGTPLAVIDDVRFRHEAVAIESFDDSEFRDYGELWGMAHVNRKPLGVAGAHVSEAEWLDIEVAEDANPIVGGLVAMYERIDYLMTTRAKTT